MQTGPAHLVGSECSDQLIGIESTAHGIGLVAQTLHLLTSQWSWAVRLPHCGLMPAARATAPHFEISSPRKRSNSSGDDGNAVRPAVAKRF